MAAAGRPERASPCSVRRTRNDSQLGAKAQARVRAEDAKTAATISGLRPNASDRLLAISVPKASAIDGMDSARLEAAGPIPNSREKAGIIGCTQYSRAKVAKPAQSSAILVRRNSTVPCWMKGVSA